MNAINLASIIDCYFLDSTGPDNGLGILLTDTQMKQQASFVNWDFVTPIWEICEGTNYPKLTWQIPIGDFICPDGITMVDFSILAAAWLSCYLIGIKFLHKRAENHTLAALFTVDHI